MNESFPIPLDQDVSISLAALSDLHDVRVLMREYADQLGVDLCFQNFEAELVGLPGDYAGPRGALFIARVDGQPAGCCGLRPLDNVDYANASEMKRLFVRPKYRGFGLGRKLAEESMETARQADYACILLDTLDTMESARVLYEELGFEEIPPYYYNPIPGAHYLKADINRR